MTAFAALTLPNDAAVNQTFNRQSIDSAGVATWYGTETVFDAKKRVTMQVKLPANGSTVTRVKQKVVIPIMDTVDTKKKIAEAYCNVEFVLPKQATQTNNLDLRKFVSGLINAAETTAAIQDGEAIW